MILNRITENLIRFLGDKFMPPNAIHFSQLSKAHQLEMLDRAPILKENHFDWWLFGSIPRTATTWYVPFPPRKIRGNAEESTWSNGALDFPYCKPIPKPGQWFENAGRTEDIVGYWAYTSPDGEINRWGARFDDIDGTMNWPSFRAGSFTNFLQELFWR